MARKQIIIISFSFFVLFGSFVTFFVRVNMKKTKKKKGKKHIRIL